MVPVTKILQASILSAVSLAVLPSVGAAQGLDGSWTGTSSATDADAPAKPAPAASEPPPVKEAEAVAPTEEAPTPEASEAEPTKAGAAKARSSEEESDATKPQPGYHLHDGFYLTSSLGGGYLRTNDQFEGKEFTARGGGVAFDFALGGTIAPGLVLGAGFGVRGATSPSYTLGGTELSPTSDAVHSQSSLYVLLDWYPEPDRGFHVFGTFGWAASEVDPYRTTETVETGMNDDLETETMSLTFASDHSRHASGYGYGVGLGYNFWISKNWSLGPVAQVQAVSMTDSETQDHVSGWSWSLGAQFAYH